MEANGYSFGSHSPSFSTESVDRIRFCLFCPLNRVPIDKCWETSVPLRCSISVVKVSLDDWMYRYRAGSEGVVINVGGLAVGNREEKFRVERFIAVWSDDLPFEGYLAVESTDGKLCWFNDCFSMFGFVFERVLWRIDLTD